MNNTNRFNLLRTLLANAFLLLIIPFGMSQVDAVSAMKTDVTYNLDNNHLNGLYAEKYKDGKNKVTGQFKDGQRVGLWSVWDSTGVLKVQRNYLNNKQFDFVYPDVKSMDVLKKNSNQIYPYLYIEERAIAYSFRIWRLLNEKNEANLFKQIDFKLVVESLLNKDASLYLYGESADFKQEIIGDSLINVRTESKSWDYSRIEIKEDFFFNKDNLLGDTRQISISFYKNKKDSSPTYSVYCPSIRDVLSKFRITDGVIAEISNLDDYFFMKAYRGEIVNSSNLNRYKKMDKKQADIQTELDLLSNEHDLWLFFGR